MASAGDPQSARSLPGAGSPCACSARSENSADKDVSATSSRTPEGSEVCKTGGVDGLGRCLGLLCMAVLQVTLSTYPMALLSRRCDGEVGALPGAMVYGADSWIAFGFLLAFHYLRRYHTDLCVNLAERYLLLCWLFELVSSAKELCRLCCTKHHVAYVLVTFLASVLRTLMVNMFLIAAHLRVRLTEAGFGAPLGSRAIRAVRIAHLALKLLGIAACSAARLAELGGTRTGVCPLCFQFGAAVCLVGNGLTAVVIVRGFTKVVAAVELPALSGGSYVSGERDWARRELRHLRWAMLLPLSIGFAASAVEFSVPFYWRGWPYEEAMLGLGTGLAMTVEILCLFLIVGLFQSRRPMVRSFSKPLARASSGLLEGHSEAWVAKVWDLAERSVDVAGLLAFYRSLGPGGAAMPHFDPGRHTTNDVVRAAIIPLSRGPGGGGSAYASRLTRISRRMPARMVTHTWSALFVHLVAAVIADALGEDEYEEVAGLLAAGRAGVLAQRLREKRVLRRRYWICAFCVNQHASICDGFGAPPTQDPCFLRRWDVNRRDTVTGDIFELCTCSEPKFLNGSPDQCEINKFDDMIQLLHHEVPTFRLVVAVDRCFNIFNRAWCVAELVEAHFLGIREDVCIFSNRVLDIDSDDLALYTKLASLTVANCEASRPEDKAFILAKIPDTENFDSQLQALIFGDRGLLRHQFIGFGTLEAAARIARRMAAISSRLPAAPEHCPMSGAYGAQREPTTAPGEAA